MKRIPGCGNWRIRYRVIEEGQRSVVEIMRAITCDRHAMLPVNLPSQVGSMPGLDAIPGYLPVVKLASHALSADRWDTEDVPDVQEIEMTDGRPLAPEMEWSNRNTETLVLPDELREVGDYAFLNCRNLRRLELTDLDIVWQRSCFMNCREMRSIVLRREHMEEDAGNIAYFVGETTGAVEISILTPDQTGASEARLIFPDYLELYTENNEARQFDYAIEGAGYPYRHVFRDRKLSWHDYDSLWPTYLGREEDKARAARMAWYRVSRPVELSAEHRMRYEEYVREHFLELAEHLLAGWDDVEHSGTNHAPYAGGLLQAGFSGVEYSDELALLVQIAAPAKDLLTEAAAMAREHGRTDCLAVLMEEEHRQAPAPAGRRKSYEL